MTLDDEIAAVERNLTEMAPNAVKAAFVGLFPAALVFLATPLGGIVFAILTPVIKWMTSVIIKFFDNKSYYLWKVQVNNAEAAQFVDAARATNQANESGDLNAIATARAAERAAFLKFWPLTS